MLQSLSKSIRLSGLLLVFGLCLTAFSIWIVRIIVWPARDLRYLPTGTCMQWDPPLIFLHTVTEIGIWLAMWTIPFVIGAAVYFETALSAGSDPTLQGNVFMRAVLDGLARVKYYSMPWTSRLKRMSLHAAMVVFFAGNGHLIDLISLWVGSPWVKGLNNFCMMVVSWTAAISVLRNFPYFLKFIRKAAELENAAREAT